tara:strand:- start:2106 stop:2657 length:552 start_codon:yes stop_codon:yes gene_type:complete
MKRIFAKNLFCLAAFLLLTLVPLSAHAGPPELQTPAPVIYLADNLDEQEKLGWCIDTVGRGFGDRLHAHSCKPFGGDVQFYYNKISRQIISATFDGKCATLLASPAAGGKFGLLDCSATSAMQKFDYNKQSSEFRPGDNGALCLAVGSSSRSAGPFMSRNLELATCSSTAAKFKQWRIKGGKN